MWSSTAFGWLVGCFGGWVVGRFVGWVPVTAKAEELPTAGKMSRSPCQSFPLALFICQL